VLNEASDVPVRFSNQAEIVEIKSDFLRASLAPGRNRCAARRSERGKGGPIARALTGMQVARSKADFPRLLP